MTDDLPLSNSPAAEDKWSKEPAYLLTLGLMIRFRALGGSGRAIGKVFGEPKSTMHRVWMPVVELLLPHLGQDGWDDPRRIKAVLEREVGALSHLGQKGRSARPPREAQMSVELQDTLMDVAAELRALAQQNDPDAVRDGLNSIAGYLEKLTDRELEAAE